MDYKNKYLKYKLKYLTAKKLYGGSINIEQENKFYKIDTNDEKTYNITEKEYIADIIPKPGKIEDDVEGNITKKKYTADIIPKPGKIEDDVEGSIKYMIPHLDKVIDDKEEERKKKKELNKSLWRKAKETVLQISQERAEWLPHDARELDDGKQDECSYFTICQTELGNCSAVSSFTLFSKISLLYDKLNPKMKQFIDNLKERCSVLDELMCISLPTRITKLIGKYQRKIYKYNSSIDSRTLVKIWEDCILLAICEDSGIYVDYVEEQKDKSGYLQQVRYPDLIFKKIQHEISIKDFQSYILENFHTIDYMVGDSNIRPRLLGGLIKLKLMKENGDWGSHEMSFTVCREEPGYKYKIIVCNWGECFDLNKDLSKLELQLNNSLNEWSIYDYKLIYTPPPGYRLEQSGRRYGIEIKKPYKQGIRTLLTSIDEKIIEKPFTLHVRDLEILSFKLSHSNQSALNEESQKMS